MSQPANSNDATPQRTSASDESRSRSGSQDWPRDFGPFLLVERIGAGGCGIVYRAIHNESEKTVALKVLRQELADDERQVKRFHREANLAKRLTHPQIVKTYGSGIHRNQHFLVQRLINGQDLLRDEDGLPLEPRLAASFTKQIADACAHAHEKGVIHRDIKPHNILIEAGQPYITDFGLAKDMHAQTKLTQPGHQPGTRPYMPPEQADPKLGSITTVSDVYSLGATLYHLLTGRAPFPIEIGISGEAIVSEIAWDDPTPPARLNPKVPSDLETICLKCLQKWPDDRYQNMAALANDLHSFLKGEPIAARRPDPLKRFVRRCQRRPRTAAAVGVLFLLSCIGLVLSGVFASQAKSLASQTRTLTTQVDTLALEAKTATTRAAESESKEKLATAQAEQEQTKRVVAQTERDDALLKKRRQQYASDLQQVEQAWDRHDLKYIGEVLARYKTADSKSDIRGVEWYYWNNRLDSRDPVLQDDPGVTGLAVSPDRAFLASVNANALKLWDIDKQTIVYQRTITDEQHIPPAIRNSQTAQPLAISPDGKFVAAVASEWAYDVTKGSLRVWNLKDGKTVLSSARNKEISGLSVVFSLDSKYVIAGAFDNKWAAWEITTGKRWDPANEKAPPGTFLDRRKSRRPQRNPPVPNSPVWSLRFIDYGRLATACDGSPPAIWSWPSAELDQQIAAMSPDYSGCIALSCSKHIPDILRLSPKAEIIQFENGGDFITNGGAPSGHMRAIVRTPILENQTITALAFSDSRLAVATPDYSIRVSDFGLGANGFERTLRGHQYPVTCIAFSHDGFQLASANSSGQILVHDRPRRRKKKTNPKPSALTENGWTLSKTHDISASLESPYGKLLIRKHGQLLSEISLPQQPYSLSISPRDRFLAISHNNFAAGQHADSIKIAPTPQMILWDLKKNQEKTRFAIQRLEADAAVSFSADDELCAVALFDDGVVLYDTTTEQKSSPFSGIAVSKVHLSNSGRYLAVGGPTVSGVYDLAQAQWAVKLDAKALTLSFDRQERRAVLSLGGRNRRTALFNLRSGEEITIPTGLHSRGPVAFSPDGERAFLRDGSGICVFDTDSWTCLATIKTNFSPDAPDKLAELVERLSTEWRESPSD